MSRVICPGCRGMFHETTDKFNPDTVPDGSMFRLLPEYGPEGHNWSTFPEQDFVRMAELVCPDCGCCYMDIDNGQFRVTLEEPPKTVYECDVCGKVCKTKAALLGHQRTHRDD